jgi:hypothetical protein
MAAALVVAALSARPVRAAQLAPPAKPAALSRLDRLEAWVGAVRQHEPGVADAPLLDVREWTAAELQQTWIDLSSLVSVIRDPRLDVFFYTDPPRPVLRSEGSARNPPPARRRQIFYSRTELERLRALAGPMTGNGGDNRLLRRAAVFHGDIAILGPSRSQSGRGGSESGLRTFSLFASDGRQLGTDEPVSHWEMGRRLLDKIAPDPPRDGLVRLWYLATLTFMHGEERLDLLHFDKALALFPTDGEILFQAACLHETFASPRVQAAFRSARIPRDVSFDVVSATDELRRAERLLRRAIASAPESIEPRIRLGRILSLLKRPKEAVAELGPAVSKATNPLLLYYGLLFLGSQAEVLGNDQEARASYARALTLYPRAQAPALALSRLSAGSGDHAEARKAIRSVFERPGEPDDTDDPWWLYHLAQARAGATLMARMREALTTGDAP